MELHHPCPRGGVVFYKIMIKNIAVFADGIFVLVYYFMQ